MNQGVSQSSKLNLGPESWTSRGQRKSTQKSQAKKGKHIFPSASGKRTPAKDSEVIEVAEGCYVDEIANVPHSQATEKKPNYEQVS